jgi:hypothetical protein
LASKEKKKFNCKIRGVTAFLAGITCRDMVSKLGRKTPTRASELMDIATKFASGQKAVEAIFRKDKQPQGHPLEDAPEASTQRGAKKKGLEDKFYGLELNHIARRYNETADELAKIALGRTTVPPDVFSRDLHQPSVKIDDTPEPEAPSAHPEVPSAQSEAPSARPEVPSAQSEAPSARLEAPSVQPEVPSAPEGETLHVGGERSGVTPDENWQTPYLQYLHRGELPPDRAEARRLARRAKSFVLLGDEKELYHRSPSGILQRCISIAEG